MIIQEIISQAQENTRDFIIRYENLERKINKLAETYAFDNIHREINDAYHLVNLVEENDELGRETDERTIERIGDYGESLENFLEDIDAILDDIQDIDDSGRGLSEELDDLCDELDDYKDNILAIRAVAGL